MLAYVGWVSDSMQKREYPGAETPFKPDEPDVLDAGDGVEGVGVDSWRRVCRDGWWFLVWSAGDWGLAMDTMN